MFSMRILSYLSFSALLLLPAFADNDWSLPCHNGLCSYDFLQSDGSFLATLNISGSPSAISDVTPAAGWTILGCDPDGEAHEIRIVCTGTNVNNCDHLVGGDGAHGKLVRLPENCGRGPFARIADHWLHDDQTMPSDVEDQLSRRGDAMPVVHGLRLDMDFAAIDHSQFGPINFSITSSNDLGLDRQNETYKRQTFDQHGQVSPTDTEEFFSTVVNSNVPCPGTSSAQFLATYLVDTLHVSMTVLLAVQGTLSPPQITVFSLTANFAATLSATLTIGNTGVTVLGNVASGTRRSFSKPLPMGSFSFPGILDVNPSLALDLSVASQMEVGMNVNLGVKYSVNSAVLHFPPSSGSSVAAFAPQDVSLVYDIGLNDASGTLENTLNYHVTPSVQFALNAFSGVGVSAITLSLDALGGNTMVLLPPGTDPNAIFPVFEGNVGFTAKAQATQPFFGLFDANTAITLASQGFTIPAITARIPIFRPSVAALSSPMEKRQSSALTCVRPALGLVRLFTTTIARSGLRPCGTVEDC